MADGTAMTIVDIMKLVPSAGLMPLWNMWWPQTTQERNAIPIIENGHRVVAEDRLPREDREDVGRDAHGGQDQDVDLRVAEEPEEVLPEERLAAARGVEEVRPGHAVEQQHAEAGGEDREREEEEDRGDEERPDDEREAEPRHARRPHVDDV
jgi:hypothetical protein